MTGNNMANNKIILTNERIAELAYRLHQHIRAQNPQFKSGMNIYPIPRGGIPAAYALQAAEPGFYEIVESPEDACIFIDDIIDSGTVAAKFAEMYEGRPTYALINKQATCDYQKQFRDMWIVFPWEHAEGKDDSITDNVVRLLQYVGEDPTRGGLLETPRRFIKAWGEWTSGYGRDPKEILKVFEDGGEKYDQMVIVKDIPIYSKCEHHLADIFGTATIAYIPNGKIVGLSKLSRLADIFARRLQVQERLTQQIADSLQEHLNPKGVGVLIRARHMCMESRGLCQQGHHTITTALHGALKDDPSARQEFMSLA
jgi:GTP cyclohydrolase I